MGEDITVSKDRGEDAREFPGLFTTFRRPFFSSQLVSLCRRFYTLSLSKEVFSDPSTKTYSEKHFSAFSTM